MFDVRRITRGLGVFIAAFALIGVFFHSPLETEVTINASPEQVWAVLAATDIYHQWNPFLLIDGDLKEGSQITVHTIFEDMKYTFTPDVIEANKPHKIVWRGTMGARWAFTGEHHFELVAQSNGTTQFKHFEYFSGLLSKPLYWYILRKTERGFAAMNEALKKRVEARC